MTKYVEMGCYYHENTYGLVKTVCRATDVNSDDVMIAYVHVKHGGFASEVFLMPENEFVNIFLN